ncbi:hypothetical protein WAI453_010069 [Rhynchosporium graminicola]
MLPSHGQQFDAFSQFRSPLNPGPGSTSSSGSGGARRFLGYSSNAPGESSATPGYQGSTGRSHPEPIRAPSYLKTSATTNGTGQNGLSHPPSFSGPQIQSSYSQSRSSPAPRTIVSPSPESPSRNSVNKPDNFKTHGQALSLDGYGSERRSKPQSINPSYPQNYSSTSSHSQGKDPNAGQRKAQSELPTPVKPPFRASANLAHPSHYQKNYRQSNLQFSSKPKPAPSPASSFQIVIPTSPAKFYDLEAQSINTLPKKRGRPFSKQAAEVKTPKKRGRPFATVESESKAKAKASGTSTPTTQKKAGRPQKIPRHIFVPQPEPTFYPFKCEWVGCQAELNNLDTLRRHIHLLHKKRLDGKIPCLWAKCGMKKSVKGEDGQEKVVDDHPEFKSRDEWKKHLEVKHLIPFSWHMGDGPKGTDLSGKPKGIINRAWLIDGNGNQVTPSVEGQATEEGKAKDLNKIRFRKMRGVDFLKEKADLKSDLKSMSGGTGMLPPQASSDEDEDAEEAGAALGTDTMVEYGSEREAVDELDNDGFGRRGGGGQIKRLANEEVIDSDEERYAQQEDMDDEGDVQMMAP